MSKIEVRDLYKFFGDNEVFKGIDFVVVDGEVVVVIGLFGLGKLIFLWCLNKLEEFMFGYVIIDGVDFIDKSVKFDEVCQCIGMVFQYFNLFLYMIVLENIMFVFVECGKLLKVQVCEWVLFFLEWVGLLEKVDVKLVLFFGGQKQCVVIVRVLVMDFEIMLFDEVMSVFDLEMVGEVLQVICDLVDGGMMMVFVMYEMGFVCEVFDWIVFMDGGVVVEEVVFVEFFGFFKNEWLQDFFFKVF